ncbi:CHASE3 domain-containing protein [Actinomadura sp. DC4]|uniref:CHASE3 domain-containing protein n=1 Tax=Actinomadura sp. DC4 TaxID=3055069 RepID=UPI0025B1C7B7|nr:CHASE3 domain-containing protein [Actinomadura sp. DC4]MDN3355366.1 CHASE3 domain-containing protein [Actinomadura sp. DC4]
MRTFGRTPCRLLAACFLSLLAGCAVAFAVSERPARRDSAEVLLAANRLERLVVDLDRGELGYVATGDDRALGLWRTARAAFFTEAVRLQRLAAENDPSRDGGPARSYARRRRTSTSTRSRSCGRPGATAPPPRRR